MMTAPYQEHESVHGARLAHGAWAAAVVVSAAIHAVAHSAASPAGGFDGLWTGSVAAFLLGLAPALAVLAAGRDAARPGVAGPLVVIWAASMAGAVVIAGPAWPSFVAWFITPAVAAALLRPDAPAWEGWALAALGLATAGVLGVAASDATLAVAAVAPPVVFVAAALWALRRRHFARAQRWAQGEQRARSLFASASATVLRVDSAGVVTDAAGPCARLLTLQPEETLGERVMDLVDPPSAPLLDEALRHVRRASGAGSHGATHMVRVTIFGRPASARVARSRDGGVVVELQALASKDARLEDLERRHAQAVASAEGKAQFYARLNHELRTPLNAVLGFADVMRNKVFGPMPVKYAEYADLIHESATHLLSLVDSVMDLSKLEAGAYALRREVLDARDIATAAVRMTDVLAQAADVRLTYEAPQTPVMVVADPRALRQILLNLLSNAIKFTPKDGAVAVRVFPRNGELVLEVSDTGPGMEPEELATLGQPYTQTRTGRESSAPGAGLGLAIVRGLTQMHEGVFEAESTLGEGTLMRVRAPVLTMEEPIASIA